MKKREETKEKKQKNEKKKDEGKFKKIIIPSVKELSKDEIIQIYKDELKRKDELILKLENENRLLLDLTMRNTKKRLEELDYKTNNSKK